MPAETKSRKKRGACEFCSSRKFIRSGLRGMPDFLAILKLRYPVRCRRCSQRQFVDFLTASLSLSASSRGQTPTRARENWRSWTSGTDRKILEEWNDKDDE
jgi:DNA-directed RNA polymerase subunit RPC12/RpoP